MLSDDFNHHQVHHNHRDSESRPEPPIQDDHHQQPTPQPRVLTILSYVLEKLVARNNHLVLSNNGTTSSYHDDDQHHHQMRKNYLKGFDGVRAPSISIPKYLERIYKYTNCSLSCFVVGYVYLDRLIHRYPDSLVVSLNIHRLLLTCVMVASKMLDDVNCNNAFFARVGGVTNSELNRLELELLFLLDFRVVVSSNVFETYCHHLEKEMHRNGATPLITSFAAHNATDVSVEAHNTHSYSVSRHYHRGESFKVAVRRRCQFTPSSEGRNVEAMADNSKEEFIQLVKRFGAFLTLKISNIFQRLDSRSAGALAGLAFALVFTWRILRSPPGSQRRLPKRQATAPSTSGVSHANADPSASIIPTSSEDSRAQNAIDEFFQTAKPTLGQIVRQRLSEGRKVTCRLLGVVLEETSPEELQNQATVRSSVLEVLLEITKFCDLYLMERVLDDESEKRVLLALEEAGVFTSGGLVKDKVLFCSTETGRTSFVRQLEPDWHIDTNPEIVTQLARFIKYQLQISPTKPERSASNVFSSTSLEQFFGCV